MLPKHLCASCWRGLQQICAITCPVVVYLQILKQSELFPVLQTEEICCDLIRAPCPTRRETFCFGEASFLVCSSEIVLL